MTLRSGFWNSEQGDRVYDAEDFNNYLSGIITDGYWPADSGFLVRPGVPGALGTAAPSVIVSAGKAYRNGLWAYNDQDITVSMPWGGVNQQPGSPVVYHLLYLVFDPNIIGDTSRSVTIGHTCGMAPVVPTETVSGKLYLGLAKITDKGNQQPVQGDIVDLRTQAGATAILPKIGLAQLATTGLLLTPTGFNATYNSAHAPTQAGQVYSYTVGQNILTNYIPPVDSKLLIIGSFNILHVSPASGVVTDYFVIVTNGGSEIGRQDFLYVENANQVISGAINIVANLTAGTTYNLVVNGMTTPSGQAFNFARATGMIFVLPR